MTKDYEKSIDFAIKLDNDDPLREFRKEFYHPEENFIYLDGNSLGRLPIKTQSYLNDVIDQQWGKRLIRSWNEGWYELSKSVGSKLSRIIGAQSDEVIMTDSTSLNLYKLVSAALKIDPQRKKIVSDNFNFPSDLYIIQGIIDDLQSDYKIDLIESRDNISISTDDVVSKIDNNTALVVLSHTAFKSSFLYDMEEITELAHKKGALVLWDLSHSVGAVDVKLNESGADLAIGCTYKYLNGGPGSPAFLYVSKDLQNKLVSPIWGWFGDKDPFKFNLNYIPADGIEKFLVGTPPILSLAAVDSGLDIILQAGIENIRRKSIDLSNYMLYLFEQFLLEHDFRLGSPKDSNKRGSHISLQHEEGYRICQSLLDENNDIIIIPDFRKPDNIRFGFSPLYNSFEEIWITVNRIVQIMEEKSYRNYDDSISGVT